MKQDKRICFAGVGSIAKRHIVNLHNLMDERKIRCTIDILRSGVGAPLEKEVRSMICNAYHSIEDVPYGYDVIFITNPTSEHFKTIQAFSEKTEAFFIEKPVFASSGEDLELLDLDNKICYVACPLRYSGVIDYLKKNLDPTDVLNMRITSASYLPAWRPDTDYRKTYSAHRELGGGVSIDLIHEWDYVTFLMGMPKKTISLIKRVSDLEIDSDDSASYIADYGNFVVEMHLDYFSRKTVRKLEITTKEDIILADLVRQTVEYAISGEKYSFNSDRNDFYEKEMKYFLDIIEGKSPNTNDINMAVKVLKLAEGKGI